MSSPRRHRLLVLALVILAASACRSRQPADEGQPPPTPEESAPSTAPADEPETPEPEDVAPGPGADYELIGSSGISDDPQLVRAILELKKAFAAKGVMERLFRDKEAALPALRNAVRHREINVRVQAAEILVAAEAVSPETTAVFAEAVRHDPKPDVRAAIARALVHYKDPALLEPLLEVLKEDPDATARANAAWALGSLGEDGAVPALIAALDDTETWVRLRSTSALKRLKARDALPRLVELLEKDANSIVRERAHQALQAITGKKYKKDDIKRWKRLLK